MSDDLTMPELRAGIALQLREIESLRTELAGAIKSRNAAMMLYESVRQSRDDLQMQQRDWQEDLRTLDSERAVNALMTEEIRRLESCLRYEQHLAERVGTLMSYRWCSECCAAMAASWTDNGDAWTARARLGRESSNA